MNHFSVIGGRFAENYVRNIEQLRDCGVINVCRRDISKFPLYYDYDMYDDYKSAINSEIDNVVVACSSESHYEIASYALQRGKNVIMEKGSILSETQWRELKFLAESQNLNFFVNYIHNWNSQFRKFADQIISNNIKITNINSYTSNNKVSNGAKVISDYLPHELSILFYLLPHAHFKDIKIQKLGGDEHNGTFLIHSVFQNDNEDLIMRSIISNTDNNKIRTFAINDCWRREERWIDDFSGAALRNMIKDFISSKSKNNIDLAIKVNEVMMAI